MEIKQVREPCSRTISIVAAAPDSCRQHRVAVQMVKKTPSPIVGRSFKCTDLGATGAVTEKFLRINGGGEGGKKVSL